MREFLLIQGEMPPGKFAPSSLLLDFLVAQAVVVGGDIGFEFRSPLFPVFSRSNSSRNADWESSFRSRACWSR